MIGGHKFALGRLVMTPGAQGRIPQEEMLAAIARHVSGDWGEVPSEDAALNDQAVQVGDRILSAYVASDGARFWIITEWDRSYTSGPIR